MIKRKVFIIKGYSETGREKVIDEHYAKWYGDFFKSTAGGAYYSDEVIYLDEPSLSFLTKKKYEDILDYGIVVYIGHGASQEDNQLFKLNENEIIKPGQFVLNSEKQIILLESCRVLAKAVPTVDLSDKIPAFEKGGIFRHKLSLEQSREIYDSHIKRCEKGLMICYACKLGGEAYNFFFSKMLLQHAINWHLDASRHCAILPADELTRIAFLDVTIIAMKELGIQQWPETEGCTNFPIAVSKF